MGEHSKIAWTHHTFNPWIGCSKVSPGCDHCYAEVGSKRLGEFWGEDAPRRLASDAYWAAPVRWNRAAAKTEERHRVFCASYADVFEDRGDLDMQRARLATVIAETPHLDWLLLTKRPHHMRDFAQRDMGWRKGDDWPENVWAGTTIENQDVAGRRILDLCKVPARVRFLSCEPLLGPVNLGLAGILPKSEGFPYLPVSAFIHWVIVGGEGHGGRPFDLAWARSLRDECKETGVAFFMKQMGSAPTGEWNDGTRPRVKLPLFRPRLGGPPVWVTKHKKGEDPEEWPWDLRIREVPT